jgi:hypothetical protein
MTRILCAAVAVAAIGCGGNSHGSATKLSSDASLQAREPQADRTAKSPLGDPDSSTGDRAAAASGSSDEHQLVTLTGCLRSEGPAAASAATPGRSPVAATAAGNDARGGSGANVFLLRNAKPEPGGGGVGANGAGGSGGPLVSGTSDYTLQGDVNELRSHINQEVRITARIDPRQIAVPQGSPEGRSGTAGNGSSAGSGTASGVTRSNASTSRSATKTSGGSVVQQLDAIRQLMVESVQTVAPSCSRP